MTAPTFLVQLFEPWANFYGDSKLTSTIVVFIHIAALVRAGGLAVTLDAKTGKVASSDADARARHLAERADAHRVVITGLVVSAISGVMLFTADLETYFTSPVYWTKMALIVLLLANGYMMTRTETTIRQSPDAVTTLWPRLRLSARVSAFLWFATAFLGIALVNAA